MLTNQQAANLGLLADYAFDMHAADPVSLAPAPDARLSPNYRIVGYLTGQNAISLPGIAIRQTVYYGFLAQVLEKPDVFVAVVRGTAGILEWIEDALFLPCPHPAGGTVEQGFYGIYKSFEYRSSKPGSGSRPAAQAIATTVGDGSMVVIGHSLGSALATYLSFDLASPALLGDRVSAALFASPRPGNAAFVKLYDQRVAAYQLWNYELDVVPRVPRGPDYTDLPKVTWIGIEAAQARIKFDLLCHHHIVSYLSMLNYSLLDWKTIPLIDRECAACILGPHKLT